MRPITVTGPANSVESAKHMILGKVSGVSCSLSPSRPLSPVSSPVAHACVCVWRCAFGILSCHAVHVNRFVMSLDFI
jgi:hypothetical protein